MRSRLYRLAPRFALALCLLNAFAPPPRAQGTAATPAVRLVAALEGYEGPSRFGVRPALAEFSPDGRTLALSGEGRTVKLYDAATGRPLVTLTPLKKGEGFNGFAFAPDSRTGATRSSADRSVSLWDLETGRLLLKLEGRDRDLETKFKAPTTPSEEFVAVPLSPDGRAVVTEVEDDIVVAWDAAEGKELRRHEHRTETSATKDVLGAFFFVPPHPLMMSASYSPDGARLVTANGDVNPKLWDAATGRLVATLSGRGVSGGKGLDYVYVAAFLPAAGAVLTVSYRGYVNLWDASTGEHRKQLVREPHGDLIYDIGHDGGRVAYSRDGRLVAARVEEDDKDEVRIWDAADGRELAALKRNRSKLLAFSPDGRTLAAAGGDKQSTAQLFDAATGQLKSALAKVEGGARTLAFSPDGRLLVTTSGRGVRLWDAETGRLVTTLDKSRFPAHFSPDGRRLVTGGTDKTAYLYELNVGRQ